MAEQPSNVTKLYTAKVAGDPDNLLEHAKGEYESVLIIGFDEEGFLVTHSSTGVTNERALWMLELAKLKALQLEECE